MTIEVTNPVAGPYTPNGVTTDFPFAFKIMSTNEIQVVDAAENVIDLGYNVTIASSGEGGTVSFASPPPASVGEFYIQADPAFGQPTLYGATTTFNPGSLNNPTDRLAAQNIVLKNLTDRGIRYPIGESAQIMPAAAERAGKFFAHDADGNLIMSTGTGADSGLRTDLAAETGSTLIKAADGNTVQDNLEHGGWFKQAGTGAVERTSQDARRDFVNVTDFGALGDGDTDDLNAIVAAFASGAKAVRFPNTEGGGVYRVSDGFEINGSVRVVFDAGVVIEADAGVLETIQIGKTTMFSGSIHNMTVQKAAYNGEIEDVGFAYHDCADSSFYDISARYFKYPHRFIPGNGQRVAYSSFWKIVAVGGYYGLSQAATGNGFTNELSFYSPRIFSTGDTDTPIYWDGGNHDRFINPTCEAPVSGTPKQSIYLGGHSNFLLSPRTEGTSWTVDDVVLSEDSQRLLVIAVNLYTTVTDNSTAGTNVIITSLSGSKLTVSAANATVLRLQRPTSSDGTQAVLTVEDLYSGGSGLSFGVNFQMSVRLR